MTVIAIHSGGDWYDASAEYLVLPDGINAEIEYGRWRQIRRRKNFRHWLEKLGGRYPTEEELIVIDDTI